MDHELLLALGEVSRHRDLESAEHALIQVLSRISGSDDILLYEFLEDSPDSPVNRLLELNGATNRIITSYCPAANAEHLQRHCSQGAACLRSDNIHTHPLADGYSCLSLPLKRNGRQRAQIRLRVPSSADIGKKLHPFLSVIDDLHSILHAGEHDQLTGVLNRRTFETKLDGLMQTQRQQVAQARLNFGEAEHRNAPPTDSLWIGIVDIDRFKRINDTYGHLIGDEVILLLARALRKAVRHSDLLFRFGGEEFVLVLSPASAAGAAVALERLRDNIATTAFPLVGTVTVSVGFTRIRAGDNSRAALDRADRALYFAKDNGRNRVENYELLLGANQVQETDLSGEIELF